MSEFDAKKSAEARDAAMEAVEAAASKAWKAAATEAVYWAASRAPEFTTDPIWYYLEKVKVVASPREPRALGPIMRNAVSSGICRHTNRFFKSKRVECHRRPLMVYESLIYRGKEAK